MLRVALRNPEADGSKATWNVVVPPAATDAAGCAATTKSEACVPPTATRGLPVRFKATAPVFRMVKVRTTVPAETGAEPKSVWSAALGELSPSAMDTELPCTSISETCRVIATDCSHAASAPIFPSSRLSLTKAHIMV